MIARFRTSTYFCLILLAVTHVPPALAQQFELVTGAPVVLDQAPSTGSAWVDVDSDGDLDLYVANGNVLPRANQLYLREGAQLVPVTDGHIVEHAAPSIGSCWADMDGDGDLDAFVVNREGFDNALYRNDGNGRFTFLADAQASNDGGNSNSASWIDVDGDGDLDLFAINFNDRNLLYLNDGSGNLERREGVLIADEVGFSISAQWGDVDGDGRLDLFLANGGNVDNQLFLNRGELQFERLQGDPVVSDGGNTIGASFGDVDNDLDLDLFVANFLGQNNMLYLNRGDGSFERVTDAEPSNDGGDSVGSVFVDLDNDGDQDLMVGNDGGPDFVYLNDGAGVLHRWFDGEIAARVGHTFGVSAADVDSDGDMDLFTADRLGSNGLFINEGSGGHWLQVELVGRRGNPQAIGASVVITTVVDGEVKRQLRQVVTQSGYNSQSGLTASFGLGSAVAVDELLVRWPSGRELRLQEVAVNGRLVLEETRFGVAEELERTPAALE